MMQTQLWAGGPKFLVEAQRRRTLCDGTPSVPPGREGPKLQQLVRRVQKATQDDGMFTKHLSDALDGEGESELSDGVFLLFKEVVKHGLAGEDELRNTHASAWAEALQQAKTRRWKGRGFVQGVLDELELELDDGQEESLSEGTLQHKHRIEIEPSKPGSQELAVRIWRHAHMYWLDNLYDKAEQAYQAGLKEMRWAFKGSKGPMAFDVVLTNRKGVRKMATANLKQPKTILTLHWEEIEDGDDPEYTAARAGLV